MTKITWTYIFLVIGGAILGAVFQYYANVLSNKKLKEDLITELTPLINRQKTARVTEDEQKRIAELQAQIKLLDKK